MTLEETKKEIFNLIAQVHGEEVCADMEIEAIRFPRDNDACGNEGREFYFKRIEDLNKAEASLVFAELQRSAQRQPQL